MVSRNEVNFFMPDPRLFVVPALPPLFPFMYGSCYFSKFTFLNHPKSDLDL